MSTQVRHKPTKSGFAPCQICTSPYRYQIEQGWAHRPPRSKQWSDLFFEKYGPSFGITRKKTFMKACHHHHEKKHFKQAKLYPYLGKPTESPQKALIPKASLNSLSQSLLEIGEDMAKYYKENPKAAVRNLDFNQIFKAQDSVSKRMEVQNQQDELKIRMAELFSGKFLSQIAKEFEEGEIVDGNEEEGEASTAPPVLKEAT